MLSRSALTKMQAVMVVAVIVIGVVVAAFAYTSLSPAPKARLIVSTTTSLYETGMLDRLKTNFEAKYPSMNVSFISQGTGLAIQTAMRGDADMILVHDPAAESKFLQGGYGVNRKIVAYNFFIIVGPSEDPAGIAGKSAQDAFKLIESAGASGAAIWISRGDNSGTHTKEKSIWKSIGLDAGNLRSESWYLEAGSGMTATLKLANEKRAYTLCDIGSYLMNFKNKNIDLVKLVEAGKIMLNVYSAIAGDPRNANMTGSNFDGSMQFIKYLVSDEGQSLFNTFGVSEYGEALFKPYIILTQTQSDPTLIGWIQEYAFINGSECPPEYQYQAEGLYSTQAAVPILVISIPVAIEDRKMMSWTRSLRA